jgi:DNA-binding NtrC family response regulator
MEVADPSRVLIVDDERVIANTLAMIFSAARYDARAVYSAEEALAMVPGWQPQLAIIDVCLPGMNGIDLAVLFKTACPGCRITLISGAPGTSDLLTAAIPFEVLAKPVPPAELLNIAARLLGSPETQAGTPLEGKR